MSFPEIVVFLLLVPPVLAKLARLMEARESPPPKSETNLPEPFADAPKHLERKRHERKGQRARRGRRR